MKLSVPWQTTSSLSASGAPVAFIDHFGLGGVISVTERMAAGPQWPHSLAESYPRGMVP